MKSTLSFLFLLCLLQTTVFSQKVFNFWSSVDETALPATVKAAQQVFPTHYNALALDFDNLKTVLATAPQESEGLSEELLIVLPLPDGSLETFAVAESSVMMPALAAKYPQIRSYLAWSTERPDIRVRMDYSPYGFNAVLHSKDGDSFISPFAKNNTEHYVAYTLQDYQYEDGIQPLASCGYNPAEMPEGSLEHLKIDENGSFENTTLKSGSGEVFIRKYRLALACTGEYAQGHGGTLESVLASYNTAVNRINEIFEREVAVRMMLIDRIEELIWLDPDMDPYQNANTGGALLSQNETVLNNIIPPSQYELGHVFTGGCVDVGGVVSGAACGEGKARGVTCHSTSNVVAVAQGTMAHEIAHQFGTSHSWSNCPGNEGQRAGEAAFEPGSGTTIMSYNGACGPENNIPGGRDSYYHVGSLNQYINFTRINSFGDCAILESIENTEPIIEWTYEDGFYIPIDTPFELNTTATDAEDQESLTYCWEQYDLGPETDLGMPIFNAPSFRTYPAIAATNRVFPRMKAVVDNFREDIEVLPTYSRDLTFRCTVRDNHPGAGGTVWETVKFHATESAGPFLVMSPNADSIEWEVGSYQEVIWDVANTNNNRVNCQTVNIKLSLNNGYNYPITLAENVQNDGSEFIVIPDTITDRARIRVEAADNIFFDISNASFSITPPTEPGYSLNIGPSYQQVCQPALAELTVESTSLLGYEEAVSLEIVDGLPEGTAYQIRPNVITPGSNTSIIIDFSQVDIDEEIEVTLQAISADNDTTYRNFNLDIVNNDFSSITQMGPINGTAGIGSPVFEWTSSPYAEAYDIEIATTPLFGESNIITVTGLTETTFTPDFVLEENTVFYWRVRGTNECGAGAFLSPFAFRTEAISCAALQPNDLPLVLSGSGTQTKESSILVQSNGTINDLNIPLIVGEYQPVNSLRLSLVSPAGTTAILFDQNCGNTVALQAGFDDQAPEALICPPTNGVLMRPIEPLSIFNGENTQGLWTLLIEVVEDGFGGGGGIESWELEFCGNLSPSAPFLVNNEIWSVPPATRSQITNDFLLAEDEDNTASELKYTLVTIPENGTLYLRDDIELGIGSTFTQSEVNGNNLAYEHNGNEATTDKFTFTIEDTESGWFGTPTFNIEITEGAPVNTINVELAEAVQIFPNPVQQEELNVLIGKSPELFERLSVVNVQGQVITSQSLAKTANRWTVNTTSFAAGIYFLRLETREGVVVKKFTVM